MFRHLSVEDLCVIALLLEEEDEENKKKKPKRIGVQPMLKKRKLEGEYWTLYKELADDEVKFFNYFRMSRNQFKTMLKKIKPQLTKKNTVFKQALSPKEKLAVCIRFLTTGDSFSSIASSYRLGISTVHSIVKDVCNAIIEQMMEEHMPTPTKLKWQKIAEDFWNLRKFPNCIGAIDGKHVLITAPANTGSEPHYIKYDNTFSIVLMAIIDANYNFICIDIGAYGQSGDGGIFSNSNIGKALASNSLNVPEDKHLPGTQMLMPYSVIGDEVFPLKTYLMRPYPKQKIHSQRKQNFNDRLSHARKVVENAFGILAEKFRVYDKRIQLKPENAHRIIMTTCILHNFIKSGGAYSVCENNITSSRNIRNISGQGGNSQTAAFNVRDNFAMFFDSPEGAMEQH